MAIRQLARFLQILVTHWVHAAFALDGLYHDAGGPIVDGLFKRRGIVRRDETNSRQKGFEIAAVFFLAGR